MRARRIDVPELEDYPWLPRVLRDALTDGLRVSSDIARPYDGAADILDELLAVSSANRIVDLASGAGGPVLSMLDVLERRYGRTPDVVLTDKYPNREAFDRVEARRGGRVRGARAAIDATSVPPELTGVRTMFNALHHLPPDVAREVFADAARSRQPIATFELVERSLQGAAIVVGAVVATTALTPWLPLRASRLALTYVVPVVPALAAWDGFASCMRAYAPDELRALVDGLSDEAYRFDVVERRSPWTRLRATCVVGAPHFTVARPRATETGT